MRPNTERDVFKYCKHGEPGECCEWQRVHNGAGYGQFWVRGRNHSAHRVAYCASRGMLIDDLRSDNVIMHTCDNPLCINPAHLRLGTNKQNMHDMWKKGRSKGLPSGTALTAEQVLEIRRLRATGLLQRKIASIIGCSQGTVSRNLRRDPMSLAK